MPAPVTLVYASLLGVVALVLQQLVGRERLRSGVSLYDGGDERLAVSMRRQANFVEQVPLILLLLLLLELNGAPAGLLHALGAGLLAARVVHPFGLHMHEMRSPARLVGALGTLFVLVVAIGAGLWTAATG